jgi:hypothetical protein
VLFVRRETEELRRVEAGVSPADRLFAAERRPSQDALELAVDHGIALAANRFQTVAVRYRHDTASVGNQALVAHSSHDRVYRSSPDTQHLGEKILRQFELISAHPIVRHQNPLRCAFLDGMNRPARSVLSDLSKESLGVELFSERYYAKPH